VSIADNIKRIRESVAAAAERRGRSPDAVQLMAVTKTVETARIIEAYNAGLRLFGENRVQELAGKREALRHLETAEFRLIGHLQTNKAAQAAELFAAIDSVDSLRLAQKLDAVAAKLRKRLPVLLEINLGDETSKHGFAPGSAELDQMLATAPQLTHVEIRGLMAIPPFTENPEGARPHFRRLRQLRDAIAARGLPAISMVTLSMGMSHDFEVAIEEGASCVRIGTAIFGERPK
jgi:pyridoxal phosphate enzyme (YggS family)